jgi:hypothetical protein
MAERRMRPATTRAQGQETRYVAAPRPPPARCAPPLRLLAIDAMTALFPRDTPAANQIESRRPGESAPGRRVD